MATAIQDSGSDQPPGLPTAPPQGAPAQATSAAPAQMPDSRKPAHNSRTVLLLFSGPYQRPDGISSFLKQAGLEVEMIDNHPDHGGGQQHDLLLDSVYSRLLERCSAGAYAAIVASPPCSTFSVSRFFAGNVPDGGPPP
eukprot:3842268-Pleurochrysis_carterae.AAC.1